MFKEADALEFRGLDGAQIDTTEKSGGRIELRSYALLDATELPTCLEWKDCRTAGIEIIY